VISDIKEFIATLAKVAQRDPEVQIGSDRAVGGSPQLLKMQGRVTRIGVELTKRLLRPLLLLRPNARNAFKNLA
jgi:hypothetical protein